MIHDKTVLMGFYLGLGDFVSAVPVMNQLLAQNNRLVIAASKQNVMLAEAIRFGSARVQMLDYSAFSVRSLGAVWRFAVQLSRIKPDLVFVSPHALRGLTSWKIPLLLAIIQRLFWKKTTIIGARDEKLARLFDVILPLDKSLDLLHREWALHVQAGSIGIDHPPDHSDAIVWDLDRSRNNGRADLVIHPGASKSVRMWPVEYYSDLVRLLGDSTEITVVGLEHELEPLRRTLGQFRNVRFFSGSLVDVVRLTAAAKAVITMDSGFSHISAFLGVHHLAIFGASSPDIHGPFAEKSELLFNKALECQPCDQYKCRFGHALCRQTITPRMVADRLATILCSPSRSLGSQ